MGGQAHVSMHRTPAPRAVIPAGGGEEKEKRLVALHGAARGAPVKGMLMSLLRRAWHTGEPWY